MINKDFFAALDILEQEKGINKDEFLAILESSLAIAYKKDTHEAANIEVKLSAETNTIKVMKVMEVVETVEDPVTQISLEDAQAMSKKVKIGDKISEEVKTKNFGRIAAQTAKQVLMQRLGEIMKTNVISEFSEKEHEIVTGIVRDIKAGTVSLELSNGLEGVMPLPEQIPGETYEKNDKIKVYVKEVRSGLKGVQIKVSRSNLGFVKRLFELEVPEIRAGLVEIKSIAREVGKRTKIAVYAEDRSVDPVGACVGSNGTRVNAIVNELNNEKIDIVLWSPDIAEFIARAISPAQVLSVTVDEEHKSAKVVVPDNKLSLAIGKDGQNARLVARLTGWKIDVKPQSSQTSESDNFSVDEQFAQLFSK